MVFFFVFLPLLRGSKSSVEWPFWDVLAASIRNFGSRGPAHVCVCEGHCLHLLRYRIWVGGGGVRGGFLAFKGP